MRFLDWEDGLYVPSDDKMLGGCNLVETAGESHHVVQIVQGSHAAVTTARAATQERTAQMAEARAAAREAEEDRGRGLALLGKAAHQLEEARALNAEAAASLSAANVSGVKRTRLSTVPLTASELQREESVQVTAQRIAAESAEKASQAAADQASARTSIEVATRRAQEARAAAATATAGRGPWPVPPQGRRIQLKVVQRPNMREQDSTEWFNGGNLVASLLEASAAEYIHAGKHSDRVRMRNLQQVPDTSEKSDHGFVSEDESSDDDNFFSNFFSDSATASFFLDSSARLSRNDNASDITGSSSESGSDGDD
jgi:hypothetical protein